MTHKISFAERGGWWVAAQAPALLLAVILPPWSSPVEGPPGHPLQWLGLSLGALGVVLLSAALITLAFRGALTPFPRPAQRARLATVGAYRFVRHPIYAGVVVATFGWSFLWLSVSGVVYAVFLALFFDRKARLEEVWLRERFPEYAGYARRVRRFVPGIY